MNKTTYTRQTLEETPERLLQFLAAVGTVPAIRAALSSRGYTEAEHQAGWKLLHQASGYAPAPAAPKADSAAAEALVAIDAWDEPTFRLARAALGRHFPAQAEFVFADLSAQTGSGALLSVKTFLDRLDQLEGKATGRNHKDKAVAKADLAAVALLATRGITSSERDRLRRLLQVAQDGTQVTLPTAKEQAEVASQAEARSQGLCDLRAFYDEWSEVARLTLTRRDYLIRLGLAQRKSSRKPEPAAPEPHDGTP